MFFQTCLAVIVLAGVAPTARATEPTPEELRAQRRAQFEAAKNRLMQEQGVPASVPGAVAAPAAGVPVGQTTPAPEIPWAEAERQRETEYNKHFGPGAYQGMVGFRRRCKYADGCDRLATSNFLTSADQFVSLQNDVENKKITPDSGAYRGRHEEIKGGMRVTMDKFRPKPGATPAFEADFIKFSDPIVKKIFTKEELLQYAERNAASSDSAPFYTYLGETLNGAGPPGKARAAFDAALERDPGSEQALSGRAEARLNMGDYPGAVLDARAALKVNPRNERTFATLKFSEGRLPAGASAGLSGNSGDGEGASAALGAGAGHGGGFAPSGSAPAALGRAGGAVPFDTLRRSDALVADARRSLGLGDSRAAVELLSKAVELNPSNAEALALAAMSQIRLKNYPEALSAAEAGLKLVPNNSALLDAKANALNYMKDYRGALAAADLAILADPNDAMAHYNRAWALGGLHDREGALASLKTAAGLNPQFAPALASALTLPLASDIIYLFPGERAGAQPAPAGPAPDAGLPSWPVLGGVAAGVLALLALVARLRRRPAPPPPAPVRNAPELLGGKFEVGREIGSGGMGVVYEGRDRSLDRIVAVKRMREEIRWDPRERARFVAEAKLVAKLRHPHIVEIHAIVEQDGEVYLIFEHIAGRTLHQVIEQEKKLPFEKARDLFRGAAAALDYAHGRGVIHRDLKPANLMVDGEGKVRVMDFGIARLAEEALSRRSRTNSVAGTPLYMAPEQEQGVARKESDAYSMALCLYEVLTGRRPFAGTGAGLLMNKLKGAYESPSKLDARLPPGLDEVFAKGLDPDPDKRYATAGGLARALESLETPRAF